MQRRSSIDRRSSTGTPMLVRSMSSIAFDPEKDENYVRNRYSKLFGIVHDGLNRSKTRKKVQTHVNQSLDDVLSICSKQRNVGIYNPKHFKFEKAPGPPLPCRIEICEHGSRLLTVRASHQIPDDIDPDVVKKIILTSGISKFHLLLLHNEAVSVHESLLAQYEENNSVIYKVKNKRASTNQVIGEYTLLGGQVETTLHDKSTSHSVFSIETVNLKREGREERQSSVSIFPSGCVISEQVIDPESLGPRHDARTRACKRGFFTMCYQIDADSTGKMAGMMLNNVKLCELISKNVMEVMELAAQLSLPLGKKTIMIAQPDQDSLRRTSISQPTVTAQAESANGLLRSISVSKSSGGARDYGQGDVEMAKKAKGPVKKDWELWLSSMDDKGMVNLPDNMDLGHGLTAEDFVEYLKQDSNTVIGGSASTSNANVEAYEMVVNPVAENPIETLSSPRSLSAMEEYHSGFQNIDALSVEGDNLREDFQTLREWEEKNNLSPVKSRHAKKKDLHLYAMDSLTRREMAMSIPDDSEEQKFIEEQNKKWMSLESPRRSTSKAILRTDTRLARRVSKSSHISSGRASRRQSRSNSPTPQVTSPLVRPGTTPALEYRSLNSDPKKSVKVHLYKERRRKSVDRALSLAFNSTAGVIHTRDRATEEDKDAGNYTSGSESDDDDFVLKDMKDLANMAAEQQKGFRVEKKSNTKIAEDVGQVCPYKPVKTGKDELLVGMVIQQVLDKEKELRTQLFPSHEKDLWVEILKRNKDLMRLQHPHHDYQMCHIAAATLAGNKEEWTFDPRKKTHMMLVFKYLLEGVRPFVWEFLPLYTDEYGKLPLHNFTRIMKSNGWYFHVGYLAKFYLGKDPKTKQMQLEINPTFDVWASLRGKCGGVEWKITPFINKSLDVKEIVKQTTVVPEDVCGNLKVFPSLTTALISSVEGKSLYNTLDEEKISKRTDRKWMLSENVNNDWEDLISDDDSTVAITQAVKDYPTMVEIKDYFWRNGTLRALHTIYDAIHKLLYALFIGVSPSYDVHRWRVSGGYFVFDDGNERSPDQNQIPSPSLINLIRSMRREASSFILLYWNGKLDKLKEEAVWEIYHLCEERIKGEMDPKDWPKLWLSSTKEESSNHLRETRPEASNTFLSIRRTRTKSSFNEDSHTPPPEMKWKGMLEAKKMTHPFVFGNVNKNGHVDCVGEVNLFELMGADIPALETALNLNIETDMKNLTLAATCHTCDVQDVCTLSNTLHNRQDILRMKGWTPPRKTTDLDMRQYIDW